MTLKGWGPLDPCLFADGLAEAGRSEAATVLVDLTGVSFFSMEAAAALVTLLGRRGEHPRFVLLPSAAVERKLITLGLGAVLG